MATSPKHWRDHTRKKEEKQLVNSFVFSSYVFFSQITENNAKRFGDERQQLQLRHRRQLDQLKGNQQKEIEQLNKLCEEVCLPYIFIA